MAEDPVETKLQSLLAEARKLPEAPGVYLMKNAAGTVIYVGMSRSLRDRVGSYFVPSADLGPRKEPMLDEVASFDTLAFASEWEALLAENRLIKDLHPKFNARMTDGKSFPYLVVTTRDAAPGVFITRELDRFKGARVFGPFTDPGALRQALPVLQQAFKFRTCELEITPGDERNRHFRPCLLHAIGRCSAPCADRIAPEAYRADIQAFLRFMESKRSEMIRETEQEMKAASAALDFEKAALLRDRARALKRLDERGRAGDAWQPEQEALISDPRAGMESLARELGADKPLRCVECVDIAHLQGGETVGAVVCFVDGRPLKSQYRRFRIRGTGAAGLPASKNPDREGGDLGRCVDQEAGGMVVRHAADRPPSPPCLNDDFAAMREVLSRRYREAGAGTALYPDLVLVDGGAGQLSAALEAFARMPVPPPLLASLAKKEELLFLPGRAEPLRLSRHHSGLRLAQAIRDEAHRFAQAYHHLLRRRKTFGEEA